MARWAADTWPRIWTGSATESSSSNAALEELEGRVPMEERRAEAAARVNVLEEAIEEHLALLRALEEAYTDDVNRRGVAGTRENVDRDSAELLEEFPPGDEIGDGERGRGSDPDS